MNKIELKPNHKRSFSSSMYLLEKLAEEIKDELTAEKPLLMQTVKKDLSEKKKKAVLMAVNEIMQEIARISEKYQLTPQEMVESHFLNSRKSKAWEILNDSLSKRMNGFGEFPPEIAGEFDGDIEQLLKLVNKL
jgi:acetaldehyde dehydrogenase (acetylating)